MSFNKEIKTYRVTIEEDYIIGVHALNEDDVIEWLDEKPKNIELIENTGDFCEKFEACLALYNKI